MPAPGNSTIVISSVSAAQTHVLQNGKKNWALAGGNYELHLIGSRDVLAMIRFQGAAPAAPVLEAWLGNQLVTSIALQPPANLPPTEEGGIKYSLDANGVDDIYSATVPAGAVKPGLQLRVSAAGWTGSQMQALTVGVDSQVTINTLPVYLFGANDSNALYPLAKVAAPSAVAISEFQQKWPLSSITIANHPAGAVMWPYLVVKPESGSSARRAMDGGSDVTKNNFEEGSWLDVLCAVQKANGHASSVATYSLIQMLMADGTPKVVWSGLGGGCGRVGTGYSTDYSGNFFHEVGHGFGLPHPQDVYAQGKYPYPLGSLLGSAWGYDARQPGSKFWAPFIAPSSAEYTKCQANALFAKDSQGRCIKSDALDNVAPTDIQAKGEVYRMFSDFDAGVVQHNVEGTTTSNADGTYSYSGGLIYPDDASPTHYSRWNSLLSARVPVSTDSPDHGYTGINYMNLPVSTGVAVYTVVTTISNATGDTAINQVYPPLKYAGNLVRLPDPTSASDLSAIAWNGKGTYSSYCYSRGCDYTVRVTYADGSTANLLPQSGFRAFGKPDQINPDSTVTDPTNVNSFQTIAVNVAASKALAKIEVLSTPQAWLGIGNNPVVLATRVLP